MKIVKSEPHPGIIYLKFETQYDVCSTFMRLQEFYESPFKEIRGKFFTLETFMDRYAKFAGNFTYTLDWGGFNVPGHVVDKFFTMFRSDMLNKEKDLIYHLYDWVCKEKKYYVIGMADEECLDHEVAHGLYYLRSDYRRQVNSLVKNLSLDVSEPIKTWLLKKGYSKPLIVDETNAYLATSDIKELRKRFGKMAGKLKVAEPFRKAFKEASA